MPCYQIGNTIIVKHSSEIVRYRCSMITLLAALVLTSGVRHLVAIFTSFSEKRQKAQPTSTDKYKKGRREIMFISINGLTLHA